MADKKYTPSPYDFLPPASAITVTSADLKEGETLADAQLSGIFEVSYSFAAAQTTTFSAENTPAAHSAAIPRHYSCIVQQNR
jgi:hypothetical protein